MLSLENTEVENPYFWAGNLPELDKWYLLVGYVHGSSDPSTNNYGRMYDGETGEAVAEFTDYKFQITSTKAGHRVFLYGDANTSSRQYFYGPRVDVVNGREPSIANLLRKYDSTIIDTVTANTISAKEIRVSESAVFEKSILLGTSDPIALNQDTTIVAGSYLGSVNPWTKLYLQNPIVNNYLASADKKFFVEFTGNLGKADSNFQRIILVQFKNHQAASLISSSEGDLMSRIFRGRRLISSSISLMRSAVRSVNEVPFGRYCRTKPL